MSNFPYLYKKTVEHLDTPELFLIYRASKGFFPKGCNKQVLLLLIEDSHPGFLSDKTKFFYFKQKDVKSVHYLKNKIDDPNNEHELKEANQNNRNDVDKILADTKEEKEAEKDDEDSETILISDVDPLYEQSSNKAQPADDLNFDKPPASQPEQSDTKSEIMRSFCAQYERSIPSTIHNRDHMFDRLEHIVNKIDSQPRRSNDFKFTQKLQFKADLGVESFLISVENYAAANSIHDQKKWIALAKSGLMNSEQGLSAQSTLEPEDELSWDRFKRKIISTIGFDPSYYRSIFRNYRRKSSERVGLSFANLVQAYRRAFHKNEILSEDDKTHILHQFICGQEGQLKTSLELEEGRLTYSNVIERASQIERALGYPYAHNAYEVMAIPSKPAAPSKPSEMESLVLLMKEMMTQNAAQMAQHTALLKQISEPKRGSNKTSSSSYRDDVKIAAGFCIAKLKYGSCTKSDCKYNHAEASAEIKKHFSSSA